MLKIYYWNEDQHNWLALDNNIVDSTNNKVTASTYHFTLFALIGQLSTSSTNTKLYKTQGDPKVYLITPNNYRRHIPDEKSFLSYGFLWNQITTVLADYLDNFPISNLIKLANNPKVYLINDRIKLWIVNEQIFNGLGLNWSAISTVNQTEFDAYQTGEPIETLEKSVTQSSGQFTSFLTIGSIGDEVRRLQQKLKDLGYFNYPSITGYFGPVTAEAVKVFQSANGIEMVGYVGPKTRQALNK
ncbi:peptidoglycan-binding protein [Patescibacteria group bacterium]|nr:peptidoglycan-binding protein [Patescibacteria group bacterium]